MLSDKIDKLTGSQKRTQLLLVGSLLSICLCCGLYASASNRASPSATDTPRPVQVTATVEEVIVTLPPTESRTPIPQTATSTVRPSSTPMPSATPVPASPTVAEPTRTLAPLWTATSAGPEAAVPAATEVPTQPVVVDTAPPPPPSPVPPVSGAGGYVCANGEACIKGNISRDGRRLYHFPGCPNYNSTEIDTSAGERWFVTAAEAEAAGWVKAGNCP